LLHITMQFDFAVLLAALNDEVAPAKEEALA
jgi:hypothetical protein